MFLHRMPQGLPLMSPIHLPQEQLEGEYFRPTQISNRSLNRMRHLQLMVLKPTNRLVGKQPREMHLLEPKELI